MRSSGKAGHSPKAMGLRLYVVNQTPACRTALENLEKLCQGGLASKCDVQIIDLLENPERAHRDQIVAIPTLERRYPRPVKRVIGDLSNTDRVIDALKA